MELRWTASQTGVGQHCRLNQEETPWLLGRGVCQDRDFSAHTFPFNEKCIGVFEDEAIKVLNVINFNDTKLTAP